MKRTLLRSYYKALLLVLGLSFASWVNAQSEYYAVSSNKLTHYLGLSIGGGEANRIRINTDALRNKAGGAASFAFHYEMQYRSWMWGLGVEGAFQHLHDQVLPFSDSFARRDMDGDEVNYAYVYTAYGEKSQTANLRIPIYFGKSFSKVYTLIGVRLEIPIWSQYSLAADMYTQGTYPWSITPVISEGINDFSSLGFYPTKTYTYASTYEEKLHITPFVEVGYEFFRTDKVNMRVGAYGAYAIPMNSSAERISLVDYSHIDTRPQTQTQANMEKNIRWNPLADSDKYLSAPHRLEVGVKLTILFNVTADNHKCMCVKI